MTRLLRALPVALPLCVLSAATLWAAEEGGHGDPWRDLLWKTINFAVLAVILFIVARKPIAGMFRNAAQETRAELAERREAEQKAQAELERQRTRIGSLASELEGLVQAARDEARAEHERLLGEARTQAERIRATAGMQVEQEFSKARKELQLELAHQTVRLAEEAIRGRLDQAGRTRIVNAAIDQMGATR